MLDEIKDNLFENVVCDVSFEIKDRVLEVIGDVLSEHNPSEATDDIDIYDWIDIINITTDVFNEGLCFDDVVSVNIETMTIYTKDCNDIICDYGFQEALRLYGDYTESIDCTNPPSEMAVAASILYEEYYPAEPDVIFAVADNILGSCELDELVLKFKKGLITPKEDTEE